MPSPLTQDAYVWQRRWTPEVKEAVTTRGPAFGHLAVLAAELSWEGDAPVLTELHPDPAALGARPIIAVLRVGGRADLTQDLGLPALAAATVLRLRAEGVAVSALQLDLDAATSQLADYARLVRAIRAACPAPLTLTALPDWLSSPDLPSLLAEADGWTLQLHDFTPPGSPEDLPPLIDPDEALAAISRAAALHRPFTVALPTYGYAAAFTPEGRFLGATTERSLPWDASVTTREIAADPVALAALVARLQVERPPELRGLIWFRLPAEGDARAWRWPTLAAVMSGRAPAPALRVEATPDDSGLVELRLHNVGEADAPLPDLLVIAERPPVAADPYAGWSLAPAAEGLRLDARPGAWLRVGETRAVGWVRYAAPTEVDVHVLE